MSEGRLKVKPAEENNFLQTLDCIFVREAVQIVQIKNVKNANKADVCWLTELITDVCSVFFADFHRDFSKLEH